MDEKKILDLLKEQTDAITPPESLSPDVIEQKLLDRKKTITVSEEMKNEDISDKSDKAYPETSATGAVRNQKVIMNQNGMDGSEKKKREEEAKQEMKNQKKDTGKRRLRFPYRTVAELGSLAAIFVLGVTVYSQSRQITLLKEQPKAAQEETEIQVFTDPAVADTEPADVSESEAVPGVESVTEAAVVQTNGANAESDEDGEQTAASQGRMNHDQAMAENQNRAEQGTSIASDKAVKASADSSEEAQTESPVEALTYASNYQQIYDKLYEVFGSDDVVYDYEFSAANGARDLGTAEYAVEDSADTTAKAVTTSRDYSETNVQEAGVDEGDIVKTDGTWIYILRQNGTFSIVRANDGSPELVSTTKLDLSGLTDANIREMYLDGDTLAIVADGRSTELQNDDEVYRTTTGYQTVLSVWDISDRGEAKQTGALKQDGRYQDSRKNGNFVYLFTSYTPYIASTYEESTMIPRINGTDISYDHFYLPENPENENYLVISSADLTQPEQVKDQKVLVSGADNFYVSTENIYITNQNYNNGADTTLTEIAKFHYKDGKITGVAAGSIKGYLNNSFSMNEYDGMLRVVSTYYDVDWEEWNALYILDEKLQQLSAIEDLAKGETIRSARFFGTTGYFVTFRQTDPLFSVDLSDPANPKVSGELKISGFSSYLHFYGENLLLGIGYEADEDTGATTGLKLSMFDISDPADVKEVSKVVLPGMTWCPSIEEYKSILVDPDKNLIGFYCDKRYFVYSYNEEKGFTRELLCDFYGDEFSGVSDQAEDQGTSEVAATVDYDNMRGLYIGDYLYLAGNDFVAAYERTDGYSMKDIIKIS